MTPHSRRGTVAAITLTVISMAAFLVMPLYVGAAAESHALSQQQLGFLAACVAGGSAVSSVAMMFLVRRFPWRPMGAMTVLLLLVPMSASLFVEDVLAFMALQTMAALGGGATYSLALTALADSSQPDRAFGFSIAAQVAFQVTGMLILPNIVEGAGINGILSLFIAMELLGLGLVWLLPSGGKKTTAVTSRALVSRLPLALALAGCFFFFFNVGAVWTYLERMAVLSGFSPQDIGNALAMGVALGIPGALLASWCGDRFGRVVPLTVGAVGTLAALLMLTVEMAYVAYVLAIALYNFMWNFSLAFQYAAVNAVDSSGRGVAAAPAFHGAGAAAGPALAAFYVSSTSLVAVNWLAGAAVILSLMLFAGAMAYSRSNSVNTQER
tara:strand:- start:53937 stop:55085 length:1149 start_codon:yes stop_codon:yes gene_type:complete